MANKIESMILNIFSMSDETWQRHTNPWSVWTRFSVLPLLIVAIWSRVWIDWWSLVPITLAVIWAWYNPRIFKIPKSTSNWASMSVLGERVWLNRNNISVPVHHKIMPNILNIVAMIGLPFIVWGIWMLNIWAMFSGCIFVYAGKLWFLDRMVWLYRDMKKHPEYVSWLCNEEI